MEELRSAEAKTVLIEFMTAMNEWEKRFYQIKREACETHQNTVLINSDNRKNLLEILERWAVDDERNFGRQVDLGCTSPPTYDPIIDVIESEQIVRNAVVIVISQGSGLRSKFRFTLVELANNWKIKKKELLNYKDKWQRAVL